MANIYECFEASVNAYEVALLRCSPHSIFQNVSNNVFLAAFLMD